MANDDRDREEASEEVESQTSKRFVRLRRAVSGSGIPITTAGVALLFSPISIVVGFNLNDYLARPILSIEYVQVIASEPRSTLPREELRLLVSSPGYRAFMGRPADQLALAQFMTALAEDSESISARGASNLQRSLDHLDRAVQQHSEFLARIRASLFKAESSEEIRRLVLEFDNAAVGKFRAPEQAGADLKAAVLDELMVEQGANEQLLKQIDPIRTKLRETVPEDGRGITFKISLLNRGSTDGLVYSRAHFRREKSKGSIPLMRTDPPAADSIRNAIRVTEVNPVFRPGEGTVGKVPSRSLVELWYAFDVASADAAALSSMLDDLNRDHSVPGDLVLKDHRDSDIGFSVILSRSRGG